MSPATRAAIRVSSTSICGKSTAGFVKSPVFTLSGITNGSTTQSGTGNAIVRFTPALNFTGRARFEFTVNANGSYTFSGSGGVAATGSLVKSATGRLTLGNSGYNSFSAIALDEGQISISNNNSLCSATVTLSDDTTLNMGVHYPVSARFHIAGDATITGGSGDGSHGIGQVTGPVRLTIAQSNVFDLHGNVSGFTGNMRFTGNSPIRFDGTWGSSAASFELAGTTSLAKRNNTTTIDFGALAGSAGTSLSGATGSGNTTGTQGALNVNGNVLLDSAAELRMLGGSSGSSSFRSGIQRAGSGFTLTWPSAPGLDFCVERSITPGDPWNHFGAVQCGTCTDLTPPPGRAFYRVALSMP